jgi:hypothetical protein
MTRAIEIYNLKQEFIKQSLRIQALEYEISRIRTCMVNIEMLPTRPQEDIMRLALGIDDEGLMTKNEYYTLAANPTYTDVLSLVGKGYMLESSVHRFQVSDKGINYLLQIGV